MLVNKCKDDVVYWFDEPCKLFTIISPLFFASILVSVVWINLYTTVILAELFFRWVNLLKHLLLKLYGI